MDRVGNSQILIFAFLTLPQVKVQTEDGCGRLSYSLLNLILYGQGEANEKPGSKCCSEYFVNVLRI